MRCFNSHIYPKDLVKLDLKIYRRTVDKAAAAAAAAAN